jgi:hypothetical protein
MANKPEFGFSNIDLIGYDMPNLRASGWISTAYQDKESPSALAAVQQVRRIVAENNLEIYTVLQAKKGDDPKRYPQVAKFPLMCNLQPSDLPPADAALQEPDRANLDDEIPF